MSFFRNVFPSADDKRQKQLADYERRHVKDVIASVYHRNIVAYFARGADFVEAEVAARRSGRSMDIPGLFLLGVAMEAVHGQPPLPTSPYMRAFVHLMDSFTSSPSDFPEAQDRVAIIKEQYESLDPVVTYIVSVGRRAVADDASDYLVECYEAAYEQ